MQDTVGILPITKLIKEVMMAWLVHSMCATMDRVEMPHCRATVSNKPTHIEIKAKEGHNSHIFT